MTTEPERWQSIREIFDEVVDLDVEERADFLDRRCDDEELRREVEELLQHRSDSMAATASLGRMVGKAARDLAEEDLRSRDLVGRNVGHIRVEGLLGRGGMGEVYVGFDETLERRVALKAIHPRHRLSAESRSRFLREARVLSQLDHPNICRIFDYIDGPEDGDFLVLELIEGRQLGAAIEHGLEPGQELEVALEIARALATAHAKGIVHRDLKPQNVMLTNTDVTKVLDFGLAGSREGGVDEHETARGASRTSAEGETAQETGDDSRTRHGQILGTPLYMSPEQARGEAVGPASDMYSFGLLLQFLLTGEAPRRSGNLSVVLAGARHGETRELVGVDKDLASLIGELTSVEPALRPTARRTVERLRWIREKPRRRLRLVLAAAAVLLVVLGLVKYTLDLRHSRDRADLRRQQAEELIDFMIGDLRSKLAPVNRLAVLDDIGDKAIEYFEAVSAEELSPRELLLRSQTLSQIGQVRLEEGDLDASTEAFVGSLNLAQKLVELDADDAELSTWLGAAHFWAGTTHFRRQEFDRAQRSFERYLAVARDLVSRSPESLEAQLELSYALNNLGSVLQVRGRRDEAIESYLGSLQIKQRLVAANSAEENWRIDLAGTHSWLGDAYLMAGRLGEAAEHHEANLRILRDLSKAAPENLRRRVLLGIAHEKVGRVSRLSGSLDGAETHFESYLEIFDALSRHDPENQLRRRELGVAHLRLGALRAENGDLRDALSLLSQSQRIFDSLLTKTPESADLQLQRMRVRIALADALEAMGNLDEAEILCMEVLTEISGLEEGQREFKVRECATEAYLVLGRVHAQRGEPERASKAWQSALEESADLVESVGNPTHRGWQAEALLALGRIEEARPIIEELRQSGVMTLDLPDAASVDGQPTSHHDAPTVP